MDTLELIATYPPWDISAQRYDLLPDVSAPFGCTAWLHNIKDSYLRTCSIKIKVHTVTHELNTTQAGIVKLRSVVDTWLAAVGLTVDDFALFRIDYDYNFYLPPLLSDILMETMQQLPSRTMHMTKASFTKSVYYSCKSKHVQLYRKDKERREKVGLVQAFEDGLLRQEVQCHPPHTRYQLRQYGLMRIWDNWVTLERENHYLTHAKTIFIPGDFYSLDRAFSIIRADTTLKPLQQKRLMDALITVQNGGMDRLNAEHSTNTVKKYLNQLAALNINPLTIKPNLWSVDFIANPFYSVHPKGRATV